MSTENAQHSITNLENHIGWIETEIRSLEARLVKLKQNWCLKKSLFKAGDHITWEGKRKTYRAVILGYNFIDLKTLPEIECRLINREGLKGRVIVLRPEDKPNLRRLTDSETDELYSHH